MKRTIINKAPLEATAKAEREARDGWVGTGWDGPNPHASLTCVYCRIAITAMDGEQLERAKQTHRASCPGAPPPSDG